MTAERAFDPIREEVARDLAAVTPFKPATTTALVAIPIAVFLLSIVLVVYGLRGDAPALGLWPVWGPAIAMVAVAYGVLTLALAQRTPGSTVSWIWWTLMPLMAIVVQLGGAHYTLVHAGPGGAAEWHMEAMCFWRISLLGIPPVILVLWFLSRGLTLRPKVAGLLGGLFGGLISEGIYRLHCGMSQASHVVPWHTGAVLVMGLLGLLAGLWWERRRIEAWAGRIGP